MKNLFCILFLTSIAIAQQTGQPSVKLIPPAGVEVSAQDRAELEAGLKSLQTAIEKLKGNPLLPDVLIYREAVRYALQYNEFFKPEEVTKAKVLLQHGEERAKQLSEGKALWINPS